MAGDEAHSNQGGRVRMGVVGEWPYAASQVRISPACACARGHRCFVQRELPMLARASVMRASGDDGRGGANCEGD